MAYATTVTMPDGRKVSATVENGVTRMADGSRPPIGAVVSTKGGDFIMTSSGGQPYTSSASQLSKAHSSATGGGGSTVNITLPGGEKTTGSVLGGKSYLSDGTTRPPAGSIVDTAGGRFFMTADGSGVPYTSNTTTVTLPGGGGSVSGMISGGKTYLPSGERPPEGAIVDTAGGKFIMSADGSGVPYTPAYGQQETHEDIIAYMERQYQDLVDSINSIRQDVADYNIDTAPIYKRYLDEALETINTYETQLISNIQQQMGGIDPATQAAIASLREGVQRQRDNMMEEMSRRGLLQSGVWMEMEDRLNKGELTAQQQLLAGRLSDLQAQLNNALGNFATMRLNVGQTYGLEGARAAEREALMRREQMERQIERELNEAYRKQALGLQQLGTILPYTHLTKAQESSLPLEWASIMGEVPNAPGYEPIAAREYLGGANIDYDSKTGEVIIAGQRIKPSAVGGYIQSGTAYIPKTIIDKALRDGGVSK